MSGASASAEKQDASECFTASDGGSNEPNSTFDPLQDADLLFADFLSFPPESLEAEQDTSTQHVPHIQYPQYTDRRPLPARVVSNRKAQQRFRQKQKAKKAAESSELLYLRQRVQELENLATRQQSNHTCLTVTQTATPRAEIASTTGLLEAVGVLRLEKTLLQAKENKLGALLADLRATSSQAAPISSFQVLCSMDKLKGQRHAARDSARARHLQELRIHPDWSRGSPVDWKQFFHAVQTGSEQYSVMFRQGPLKNHNIPVRELLSLPMPSIAAMVMQYKQLCHNQLGQSDTSYHDQQQQQQQHCASNEVDVELVKEYVAIGMVGSEADPLEPFRLDHGFADVMRADIAWLPKWCRVLDAMQLAQEQQNELAGISHWYTSTIQCLQQQASSLCEQLKEALLPFTAQSHVSMQVLRWLQLFKTALRSSMSVGCK